MFDEYLEPPRVDRPVSPASAVPVPVNSAGAPSSTTIDQDAPSPSHSSSSLALQSPSLQQGAAAEPTIIEDNPLAPVANALFVNMFVPESSSEASSSGDGVKIGRRVFKSNSLTEAEEEDVAKEKFMLLCSLTKGCMKTEAHNGVKSISLTEAEEEAVAREVHATHAGTVSGPDPEPVQEDQTGSNFGKLHVSLAGPNPEHMDG
ncbi:hypothetical protein Tco_0715461 [Tanacetum coccineum]